MDYDNASMTVKNTFTALTDDLLVAMCRTVAYGQSAVVAASQVAALTVVKNSFENVSNNSVSLPSSTSSTVDSQVTLGASLEEMYKTWECGSETCAGKLQIQTIDLVHVATV